jgi:hypothetical protein
VGVAACSRCLAASLSVLCFKPEFKFAFNLNALYLLPPSPSPCSRHCSSSVSDAQVGVPIVAGPNFEKHGDNPKYWSALAWAMQRTTSLMPVATAAVTVSQPAGDLEPGSEAGGLAGPGAASTVTSNADGSPDVVDLSSLSVKVLVQYCCIRVAS